jgi:hypothetical protein
MSDSKVVNAGENTPEEVAYKLFNEIAYVENIRVRNYGGKETPSRKWILDTYAECLRAVRTPGSR